MNEAHVRQKASPHSGSVKKISGLNRPLLKFRPTMTFKGTDGRGREGISKGKLIAYRIRMSFLRLRPFLAVRSITNARLSNLT